MKILHVIRSVNPQKGGPIEGITQFCAMAPNAGHLIEIASLDDPREPFVRSFAEPLHALGPSFLNYGLNGRAMNWMRRNASRYDIVVVNGLWQYHSFATRIALQKSSTPYVVFAHGMLNPWFKRTYPVKHLKKSLYWPWAESKVLADAAAVLFTCEEECILARNAFTPYICNEIIVRYGTAGPLEESSQLKQEFLGRFADLRGKRIALFLGRLHPVKGCDLAIKAFAQVMRNDPAWQLVIAGPDEAGFKATLKRLASDLNIGERITWTGMLGQTLKWGSLSAAEILLLPSHTENFGLVVAEALACGLPTIISNKVNIWREIDKCGAGIVGPDDIDGTCSSLANWLALDPSEAKRVRGRARLCFETHFEISAAALQLWGVLESIVSRQTNSKSRDSQLSDVLPRAKTSIIQ